MSVTISGASEARQSRELRGRELAKPLPFEGENGLFTQSWFAICQSSDLKPGDVRGEDFLDGRVVVFRGQDGIAHVTSAFCPHLGADLSVGEVIGNELRCAFHHWKFNGSGACTATGVGDAPPPRASLFKFPTQEKFGIIWAFNGETPLYDLPDFPYAPDELEIHTSLLDVVMPVDPWVLCCNTPDFQHIKALHGIQFDSADPDEDMEWSPHSMMYDFKGTHKQGERIENRLGIFGTSLYYQHTIFNGKWFGFLTPFGLPSPGKVKTYLVVAVRKDMGTREEKDAFVKFITELETQIVMEDVMVMKTMRFAPANLTKSDKALGKFFHYLRTYPRAHPSAGFIR